MHPHATRHAFVTLFAAISAFVLMGILNNTVFVPAVTRIVMMFGTILALCVFIGTDAFRRVPGLAEQLGEIMAVTMFLASVIGGTIWGVGSGGVFSSIFDALR